MDDEFKISVSASYASELPRLTALQTEAKFILAMALDKAKIKFHAMPGRVKSIDSLLQKIEKREQLNGAPFQLADITDRVGIRVVCLFRSDISRIGEEIRRNFSLVSEDNKIDGADVTSFGYASVHFIVKLPESCSGPRYDAIKGIPIEIQVRTIAMDAWAAASHYLDYKSERGVPANLLKDFHALSGLFYVADTHFELFYNAAMESRANVELVAQSPSKLGEAALDLDTLSAYLRRRFPDRAVADTAVLSELLDELISAGFTKVSMVEAVVSRGLPAFLKYEEECPPGNRNNKKNKRKYFDVGALRVLFEIMDDKFLANQKERSASEIPIDAGVWDEMLSYRKYATQ